MKMRPSLSCPELRRIRSADMLSDLCVIPEDATLKRSQLSSHNSALSFLRFQENKFHSSPSIGVAIDDDENNEDDDEDDDDREEEEEEEEEAETGRLRDEINSLNKKVKSRYIKSRLTRDRYERKGKRDKGGSAVVF